MKQRLSKDKIELNYFCTKHRVKSTNNNNKFICNAKIVYNRKEKNFYFIHPHSAECNDISEVIIILKISKKKLINYRILKI